MIHLGYEIGTGKPVTIPLAHMAVTGQTQQSGKTTTLEALIDRGGVRAVVFVTKPGEKSFTEGRRILPYFKERADWEYVKDLLESRTGQRIGSQVGYLMRACKGAKTLQQVRENIDGELDKRDKDLKKRKAHTSRPSVHEVLAGYIDLILHELRRVPYTDKLEIERGVNIMDLSGIDENIQDMIIRSVVDRIHKHEHNAVVVVPEAWKVIPEGGRSLVFEALHTLIREGATNGNFVWIDAQDLAIVNKRILKSVTVWILGKQQEANEVVRTIRHLIAPVSIHPDQIKTLGIGEFLACSDTTTRRVYVQPRWLGDLDAQAIAKREETIDTAARIFREKKRHGEIRGVKDATETVSQCPAWQMVPILNQETPNEQKETPQPTDQVDGRTEKKLKDGIDPSLGLRNSAYSSLSEIDTGQEETMWKEKYEALKSDFDVLQAEFYQLKASSFGTIGHGPDKDAGTTQLSTSEENRPAATDTNERSVATVLNGAREEIYHYVVKRATDDPRILQLLTTRPELCVRIEPKVLEVEEGSARGQVAKLIHEGFFAEPQNGNATCKEILTRRRFKGARVSVYRALEDVAGMGFLIREKDGYISTGKKVTMMK